MILKYKNYKVNASHQMLNCISEISEVLGRLSAFNSQLCADRQASSVELKIENIKGLKYIIDSAFADENVFTFLQKMNTWKASSFDDFLEAIRLLVNENRLRFKRVDVSHKVSYSGLSKLAELKNSPPESSSIFQLIDNNDYHPLIRCSLFTWIMLKHPIFDDTDVNILMAGLWQNIILLEWKPILYHVLAHDCFWMMDLIFDRNHSRTLFGDDPSKFVELNLIVILKTVKGMIEHQDLLQEDIINKVQVNVSNTGDGYHQSVEVSDPVVNSSRIEIQESSVAVKIEPHVNTEKLISKMIEDKEYSINDLMVLLEMKHRGTFSKNYLGPALDLNLIKMTIPDKPTSKNQRYVLNSDII